MHDLVVPARSSHTERSKWLWHSACIACPATVALRQVSCSALANVALAGRMLQECGCNYNGRWSI